MDNGRMPRPSSPNLTMALLDAHLTYDPKTGELRTKKMGKLLDPERLTKIGGISIHPARAAYAMGNLHIWDKVGFADGNPRNLKIDNLIRVRKQTYVKSGNPRKPYTRKQEPDPRTGVEPTRPPAAWTERISDAQVSLIPKHTMWSYFLNSYFAYDRDKGTLKIKASGTTLKVVDRNGEPRTIDLPKFADSKLRSLRIDRLAWLLLTGRLPGKETTRLAAPDLRASNIQWHPEGIPRADPRPVVKPSGSQWLSFVYHNNRTTKVGGHHLIEEEAEATAAAAAEETKRTWESGLISLADYVAGGMVDYCRVEPTPTPEEPEPELDDNLEPIVRAPQPPAPTDLDTYVYPTDPDEQTEWPEPEFNYVPPPRKPWVYVPSEITLEDLE